MRKILAILLALVMLLSLAACTKTPAPEDPPVGAPTEEAPGETTEVPKDAVTGTIMLMSNMSAGAQYEAYAAYLEYACENLGYKLSIVYGDTFNDPAANLEAVKNAMTSDVVGLIMMQDGGVVDIMAEYPELYVVGFLSDMASVYTEGGASAACKDNDHFLGAIADGWLSGVDNGHDYSRLVIEKGYKKVSTVIFPVFAYPQLTVADATFRADIEAYNATAADADKIEIVGEAFPLLFQPLPDSYFMDAAYQDLDCVVAICAGVQFVYPALKAAIGNGTCSADTKLLTSGFENDADILGDFGEGGVIQSISIASVESLIYPIVLLDNAIQGAQYPDFVAEPVSSPLYLVDNQAKMDGILTKCMFTDPNPEKFLVPWADVQNLMLRFNAGASYADLLAMLGSDAVTTAGF